MTAAQTSHANIPWRGAETIDAARAAIARHESIELRLPAGFHHAIHACLRRGSAPAVAERLDVSGGAELLQRLAQIKGLDVLARLGGDVDRARASVRLSSPAPTLVISFGGAAPTHS